MPRHRIWDNSITASRYLRPHAFPPRTFRTHGMLTKFSCRACLSACRIICRGFHGNRLLKLLCSPLSHTFKKNGSAGVFLRHCKGMVPACASRRFECVRQSHCIYRLLLKQLIIPSANVTLFLTHNCLIIYSMYSAHGISKLLKKTVLFHVTVIIIR